ncbi:MAG: response regulator [gamma proteobacterium symbiont of Taylorina sp.]|nr:response regulator [gamma proteobacterium symbiont of Taylorina sp.]
MAYLDISKLRFLLIDDFANYRSMLRSILLSCGAQHIEDVSNAEDALELLIEQKFDVILCDYNLGDGKNGQQLLEEVMHRKIIPYGTIYIMVTAENTQGMVMAAVEYRPDGYLNKPFPKDLLVKRLELLVEKKAIMKSIYKAYNKNDYTKALSLANKAMLEHSKQALEIGKLKGEIALAANELDIAEQVYDKALTFRDFQWARVGKAKVLLHRQENEQENKEQAKLLLEAVIEENKNYIEAYDLLASILEFQGKSEEVQKILSTATQISPNTVSRQQHLSKVAIENNDFEAAENSLKQAIRHGKHSCFGKIGDNMELVKIYADNGQPKKVVQTLKTARASYKKDKDAMLHTQFVESMAQQKLGNEDRARELFQEAIKKIPDHLSELPEELQNDLLVISVNLGETELAEALEEDINNTSGTASNENKTKKYHYLLINGKGIRLYEANKIKESIPLFEEAAQHLSNKISVNMNAAQALLFQFKSSKNIELLTKARHYLDISQQLDKNNEKYKKLENIYSTLN